MAEAYFVVRGFGEEALRNAVLFVGSCEREDHGARKSEKRVRQKLKSQYEAGQAREEVNKLWLSLWLQASIQS
jgi:hypothetical protein